MADLMRSAEYSKEDGPYILPVGYTRLTAAEITALATANKLNIGSIYFDTTNNKHRLPTTKSSQGNNLVQEGVVCDITANTILISGRADNTGTPGNTTLNAMAGRAAFAAAGTSVVVTNSRVTAASEIFIQLRGARDTTLTEARISAQGAGTFTVTGNAAATAAVQFSFWVVN